MRQPGNMNYNSMNVQPLDDQLIASDLLSSVKASIKSTASALTETATPEVRRTLEQQLQQGLNFHQQLTNFMMQKGWYKPYDVQAMIQGDLQQTQQVHQQLGEPTQQHQQYSQQYGQPQYGQPQYNPQQYRQ
jgi:similar to spore coat protein